MSPLESHSSGLRFRPKNVDTRGESTSFTCSIPCPHLKTSSTGEVTVGGGRSAPPLPPPPPEGNDVGTGGKW